MPPYGKRRRPTEGGMRTRKSKSRSGWVSTLASTRRLDPYSTVTAGRGGSHTINVPVDDWYVDPRGSAPVHITPGDIYQPEDGGHSILNPVDSAGLVPYTTRQWTSTSRRSNLALVGSPYVLRLPKYPKRRSQRIAARRFKISPMKKRLGKLKKGKSIIGRKNLTLRAGARSASSVKRKASTAAAVDAAATAVALRSQFSPSAMRSKFRAKAIARNRFTRGLAAIVGIDPRSALITLNADGTVTTTGPVTVAAVTDTINTAVGEVVSEYGESGKAALTAGIANSITTATRGMIPAPVAAAVSTLAVNAGWDRALAYMEDKGINTESVLSAAGNAVLSVAWQFVARE